MFNKLSLIFLLILVGISGHDFILFNANQVFGVNEDSSQVVLTGRSKEDKTLVPIGRSGNKNETEELEFYYKIETTIEDYSVIIETNEESAMFLFNTKIEEKEEHDILKVTLSLLPPENENDKTILREGTFNFNVSIKEG